MDNPFQTISQRLSNIEALLLDLKHAPTHSGGAKAPQKEIGRVGFAMQITGLAKSTIYGLVQRREIPHSRKGKHLYFTRSELEAWLLEDRVKTREEIEEDAAEAVGNRNR